MSSKWLRRVPSPLGAVLLLHGLGACSEPDQARVIGLLSADPHGPATISAPASVTAGTPFTPSITTYGSSNCTRVAGEQVTGAGSLLRVVPLDEVPTAGSCFRDLAPFEHRPALQFGVVGPGTLRVVGYFGQDTQRVLDSVDVAIDVEP